MDPLLRLSRRALALSISSCCFSAGRAFAFASARRAFLVAGAARRRGFHVGVRAVPGAPGLLVVVVALAPVPVAYWPLPLAGGGSWFEPAPFPGGVGRFWP